MYEYDFIVTDGPSIFLVRPTNDAAKEWIAENVQEDAQFLGDAIAVEHRYILSLLDGIKEAGFTVGRGY